MPKKRNHSASAARTQNLKVAREEKAQKRQRSIEPNSDSEENASDDENVFLR